VSVARRVAERGGKIPHRHSRQFAAAVDFRASNRVPDTIDGVMSPETEKFTEKITKHFAEVDPLTQVVLKGHLLLEERLNATVRHALYNPELFDRMKLNFHHKMLRAIVFRVEAR
jgi:hypothetical protein